jgi:predicted nucleic acid-binding protein
MQVIISDTSCLIDLRKALLIEAFLLLPYEISIPDILFAEELIKFTDSERSLLQQGLKILPTSGEGVRKVQSIQRANSRLSINDCFAFVLAESIPNSILLTGDGGLRDLAIGSKVEVHGVLWIIDRMYEEKIITANQVLSTLLLWQIDHRVRLPKRDLKDFIERFRSIT